MRFYGKALARAVDLSSYTTAELDLSWYIESSFDAGDYLSLDISTDGGATWQTSVRQLSGNQDQENTWHHETVDLTPYLSSNVLIRFLDAADRGNEDANVDNVRLVATGSASASLALVQEDEVERSIVPDEPLPVALFAPLTTLDEERSNAPME